MLSKFFKPQYFCIILGCFLLTTGFGCKGLSTAQQSAVKPVTLEYWTVFDDVDALNKLIAKFRAERPYITVKLRQLQPAEVYPRLVEALAEDRGPDIISISNRWLGQYQSKLAPMPASFSDAIIQVTKTTLGTNTNVITATNQLPTIQQLDQEYVQAVKQDVVRDGKIYGLPLSVDTMAIFYNKDLLDRAGIPEAPKTWDEFQTNVKKITRYNKSSGQIIQSGVAFGTGNNVPGSDDILAMLFKQSGVEMTIGDQAVFNIPPQGGDRNAATPAMAVLNFYTDFANPNRDTYSWSETEKSALDSFINGKVGFFFGYSYHNPIIRARGPQLNYRIIPLLQLNPDNPVNVANYWVQTVVSKSKHQNEAWSLINYLTHSTITKEYLTLTKRPTALRAYIAEQQLNLELQPFVQNLLVANNWYRGKNYEAAVRAISDMLHQWLQDPGNPQYENQIRQSILDTAAAKINQTL